MDSTTGDTQLLRSRSARVRKRFLVSGSTRAPGLLTSRALRLDCFEPRSWGSRGSVGWAWKACSKRSSYGMLDVRESFFTTVLLW